MGIGRWGKAVALVAAGAAGGGAAFAVASVPDSSDVIHACVKMTIANNTVEPVSTGPNVRIIDPANQLCAQDPAGGQFEQSLTWNQSGPTGPAGMIGPTGPSGSVGTGVSGVVGPPTPAPLPPVGTGTGGTGTVSGPVPAGSTLTLPGGGVITISGEPSPTLQLAKLPGSSNSKSLSLLLDATEVPIASYALLNSSTGKAAVHDISITRNVDRSSAKLAEACATGEHFTKATLAVRKAGHLYLTIAMKDVRISSYQSGGRSGAKTPVEALTLNAATLSFAYAK